MHVAFIPYGKRSEVELMFRDMEAQKHKLRIHKEGEKDKYCWFQAQVRIMPFGVVEYVFPREDLDVVLNTLTYQIPPNLDRYELEKIKFMGVTPLSLIKKVLKLEPIPKDFSKERKLLWIKDNVMIIPLGIRRDEDIVAPDGEAKGWTHEAI